MKRMFAILLAFFGWHDFDITDGAISKSGSLYQIETPELRATIKGSSGASLVTTFTYLGPTVQQSRLSDGELRHQFALVLRAQDICNRVYISVHFDTNEVYVQVKRNPGKVTHKDCGDEGYTTVADWTVPPVRVGEPYYLSSRIVNTTLAVNTGGLSHLVKLPSTAFEFNGPAGLRTDNVRVRFSVEAE